MQPPQAARSMILVLSIASLLALTASATEKPTLALTTFMTGHWVGEAGGAFSEEVWTAPEGDSMVGMWRLVKDGKTQLFELLTVSTDTEHGLVMRLRHFNADLVGWEEKDKPFVFPLVRSGEGEVAFEGEGTEGKVRLTYRRDGAEGLVAVLEKGGKTSEFRYRRKG